MSPMVYDHHAPNGHHHENGFKKLKTADLDGFGTRAIHIGSEPSAETGAVIPAISLSTTYKQDGVGNHKVRLVNANDPEQIVIADFYVYRASSILAAVTPIVMLSRLLWRPLSQEVLSH